MNGTPGMAPAPATLGHSSEVAAVIAGELVDDLADRLRLLAG